MFKKWRRFFTAQEVFELEEHITFLEHRISEMHDMMEAISNERDYYAEICEFVHEYSVPVPSWDEIREIYTEDDDEGKKYRPLSYAVKKTKTYH